MTASGREAGADSSAKAVRTTRVLVVDDNVQWTDAIGEALRADGYNVTLEHDGLSAVEQIRAEPPDILVTDFFLTSLDGGKLCQIAKSTAERPIATIILTAGSDRSISHLRAPFADVVIAKNAVHVVIEDLRRALENLRCSTETETETEHDHTVIGHERLHPRLLSRKLHHLKHYVDALHESMADVVVGVDEQLRVYLLNHAAAELLETTEEQALAKPLHEVLGLPADAPTLRRVRAVLAGTAGDQRPFEVAVHGSWLRLTIARLSSDLPEKHVLLIAQDLSDLRAEEQTRSAVQARLHVAEKLSALGQLVAGVSHEINNPLAALAPNLELLRENIDPLIAALRAREGEVGAELAHTSDARDLEFALREIPELLGDCIEASNRIRSIVASMRLFSHMGQRSGVLVSVDDVLASALALVSNQIKHRAEVIQELGNTPPLVIDPNALGQAILNVLLNAAQAIESARGNKHWIRASSRADAAGIVLEISNSGPAIARDALPRIFDPFFTTKSPGQGVGLGLSIAHEAIRRHGGHIEVSSEPDKPVTFRIWLPRETGLVIGERVTSSASSRARGARLLVVDDEAIVRKSIRRALEGRHEVTLATGGRQALELLEGDSSFDLILCDLIMPDMSGMELYAEVKRRKPLLASRFAFLTGGTNNDQARDFLQQVDRPRAYKPVGVAELRSFVARCLE